MTDQQLLLRTIPGIERLEPLDKDTYAFSMHIKQAPLRGSYDGHITITEQQPPYHCRIVIEGNGRQGTINGSGVVHLNGRDETTIVAYQGGLNIGKLGTFLPPALMKGAAKLLVQQFFTGLADQLHGEALSPDIASPQLEGASVVKQPEENIVILPQQLGVKASKVITLSYLLVRQLKLGAGDPAREAVWANRIGRIGMISGLLVLVWIGTRLPRR
jgi:hypothetical protein